MRVVIIIITIRAEAAGAVAAAAAIAPKFAADAGAKLSKGFYFTHSTGTGTMDVSNAHAVVQCWLILARPVSQRRA